MKLEPIHKILIVLLAAGALIAALLLARGCQAGARELPWLPGKGAVPAPGQTQTAETALTWSPEDLAATNQSGIKLTAGSETAAVQMTGTGTPPGSSLGTTGQPTPTWTPGAPREISPPVTPTNAPPEPLVAGNTPTPPGRQSPDVQAEPLIFTKVWVFPHEKTGAFAGRANVTNAGAKFLNYLTIEWQILDAGGSVLDKGWVTLPNLAPEETTTLWFEGANAYQETWYAVTFKIAP